MSEMDKQLDRIWAQRSLLFRKEIMPYLRTMAMSGLPAVTALIMIWFLINYFPFVRDLPSSFPITALGTVCLMIGICWSPLRSFLKPADTVFLIKCESRMMAYMRRSFIRAALQGYAATAVILLFFLPIYHKGSLPNAIIVIIAVAILLKAFNMYLAWQERLMVYDGQRNWLRLLRWLLTAIMAAAWLEKGWLIASLFCLLVLALLYLLYRLPNKHYFAWDRLMHEEESIRKKYYAVFGMFTDIPSLVSRPHRRSYLSWLLPRIRFSPRKTYVYLYTAGIIRLELSGIIIRLLAIGAFVTYWAASEGTWSGWLACGLFILALGLIGLQLGNLLQMHRDTVWRHVYPLSEKEQINQLIQVDRFIVLISALLLMPFLLLPQLDKLEIAHIAVIIGYPLVYSLVWRPSRIRAKFKKIHEDERF